jgi:hypothetical protein
VVDDISIGEIILGGLPDGIFVYQTTKRGKLGKPWNGNFVHIFGHLVYFGMLFGEKSGIPDF